MNQRLLPLLVAITVPILLPSCETVEPTPEERLETQASITRERASLQRQAAAERSRMDELGEASRMMHRGAADGEPLNDELDEEYRAARGRAEELDTAERMMGRGAAN